MASLAWNAPKPQASRALRVDALITATAAGAATAIGFAALGIGHAVTDHPGRSLAFLGATILLQLFAVRLPHRGTVGVSAVGLIAAGMVLGAGPAMAIGVSAALVQYLRSRGLAYRALFDASNYALSAGAAALTFEHTSQLSNSGIVRVGSAVLAGLAYTGVNHALLCLAMGTSEGCSPIAVWQERFSWARYHFLAFGALAILAASAYAELGAVSLFAFVLPPTLLAQSMRGSFLRTCRRPLGSASASREHGEVETRAA